MPFKSKSQRRACYAKGDPDWDCDKWEKHTAKKNLPEKVTEQLTFKDWLKMQEVSTGTNAVAIFARPVGIGMVTRTPAEPIVFVADEGPLRKKKK
jgi:hypothetical protein